MDNRTALTRLHYELICGVIENGACPSNVELANRMGASVIEVEELLRSLSEIHGVVLHPHVSRPWVVHPFSLTPTLNWVEGKRASWWAPCIWCGLGIATLVGGEVSLHTRFRR
jgi:Alkylmercury lyase